MTPPYRWMDIDWPRVYRTVHDMQGRLAVAYTTNDLGEVRHLVHNLVASWAARALAVRLATTEQGPRRGDRRLWNTPEQKFAAIGRLAQWRELPLHPEVQCLWKVTLEPIAEARADRHSYGWRPARGVEDAQTFLHMMCRVKTRPHWVMHGRVRGLFEPPNHASILRTPVVDPALLRAWLRAGAWRLPPAEQSLPGAAVHHPAPIAPVVANLALDGLQQHVLDGVAHLRKRHHRTSWSPKVHLVRYGTTLVVTGATRRILERHVKALIERFLAARGLSLDRDGTHIASLKQGVDVLGVHLRLYPQGGTPPRYTMLTTPPRGDIQRLRRQLRTVFTRHATASAMTLIQVLNPLLREWALRYRSVSSTRVYTGIDHYVWCRVWQWMQRKHPAWRRRELVRHYFRTVRGNRWVFFGRDGERALTLFRCATVRIRRHRLVLDRNPFLPLHQEYFRRRLLAATRAPGVWDSRRLPAVRRVDHTYPVCEQLLLPHHEVDLHHVVPRARGGGQGSNLVALHRECHRQVTHTHSPSLIARLERLGVLAKGASAPRQ